MSIDITDIIKTIITLICAVISYFLIPWLKGKVSAENRERIVFWLTIAVQAAEEAARSGMIDKPDKYEYVIDYLASKGIIFDELETEALINSAVWELINQFKADEDLPPVVGGTE